MIFQLAAFSLSSVRQFQRPSAGRNHVFYPALSGRLAVGNFKSRQDKDNVHCMALCQGKSRQVLVNSYSDVPYLAGVGGSFIKIFGWGC